MFGCVAVLIAGAEQVAQQGPAGLVQSPGLVQDGPGDGRGGQVQALAQLLAQQTQDSGVEILNIVGRGQGGQCGQALAHQAFHVASAAQAGVVGQLVFLPAPEHGANPGQRRQRLQCQEYGLPHQRRRRRPRGAGLRLDVDDLLVLRLAPPAAAQEAMTVGCGVAAVGRTVSGMAG